MTGSDASASRTVLDQRFDAARQRVAPLWEVVRLTLPSAVIPIAAGVILCALSQGLEALRVIAEGGNVPRCRVPWGPAVSLFVATGIAGLTAWYCARVALYIYKPSTQDTPTGAAKVVPRIWGVIPGLAIATGYAIIAWVPSERDGSSAIVLFAGGIGLSIALYLFFAARRVWLDANRSRSSQSARPVRPRTDAEAAMQPLASDLPRTSRLIFGGIATGSVLLCAWIVWKNGACLAWLTTPGVVMLSVASWVTAITWLLYESRHHNKPFVRWLVVAAIVFAALNINEDHAVRRLDAQPAGGVLRPLPIAAAVSSWMASRPDRARYGHAYPVFIVAAEGGGIRAAMTASLVMGYLTDVCPAFPIHTLAISGVSGGSVGSAAYVAMARRHRSGDIGAVCPRLSDSLPLTGKLADFVAQDFLTPALAEGLYPGILAWFLPFPWTQVDRARALELAFSRGVEETAADSGHGMLFERSFLGNASDPSLGWKTTDSVPALILNTTRVETGQRVLASQIEFGDSGVAGVLSTYDIDPQLDLRLSTAATLSARFPVVSPEGVIAPPVRADSEPAVFRLVDGGYYDNSGLATALALAALVRRDTDAVPVVIRIGYAVAPEQSRAVQWGGRSSIEPWAEALSPVRSLLNARDAHTADQIASLERLAQATTPIDTSTTRAGCPQSCAQPRRHPIHAAEFLLLKDSVPYILGWLISGRAVDAAREALRPPASCDRPTPVHAPADTGKAPRIHADTLNNKEYCAIFGMLNGSAPITVRAKLR